jgi:hypothetical protein
MCPGCRRCLAWLITCGVSVLGATAGELGVRTTTVGTKSEDYRARRIEVQRRSSEEGHMCPACVASTAAMIAGAGSTGGILTMCIGKFRKVFRANRLGRFQITKEKKEK